MPRREPGQPALTGIYTATLLALWRPAALWSLVLLVLALLQMAVYPLLAEIPGLAAWLPARMAGLQRLLGVTDPITSPAGFLNAAGLFLVYPLLLSVFAVLFAAPLLTRDSPSGGLDLLLVRPVSRRRILLEKFAAVGTLLGLMCLLVWVVLAWRITALGVPLSLLRLAGAMLGLFLLALMFTGLALTLGALTGRTGLARLLGLVLLGLGYLFFLSPHFDLPFAGLGILSPFGYALSANPLGAGIHLPSLAVLLLATLAWLAAGAFTFQRKDL